MRSGRHCADSFKTHPFQYDLSRYHSYPSTQSGAYPRYVRCCHWILSSAANYQPALDAGVDCIYMILFPPGFFSKSPRHWRNHTLFMLPRFSSVHLCEIPQILKSITRMVPKTINLRDRRKTGPIGRRQLELTRFDSEHQVKDFLDTQPGEPKFMARRYFGKPHQRLR